MRTSDFAPATGGRDLPAKYTRQGVKGLDDVKVKSDLDKHIVRLLALNPELQVKFRNQDLASLDDRTKEMLLADMNQVLGIKPLRKTKK
jgi:hypothetical protein